MKRLILGMCLATFTFLTAAAAPGDGFLKGKILRIDKESITETGGSSLELSLTGGLNTSSSLSLLDVERALQKAAVDDDIAMVYLNYDHVSASQAAAEEIRCLLLEISRCGKPVIAYGASLSNASYYLASAADRVFLHPKGSGTLNGMASTQFFLKDLLDTLGVQVQLIRHGKYKSAGEMYIRNDISPENRRQYEELLTNIWDSRVDEIAASRGVEVDSLEHWVGNLALGTAQTWVDKGLVDGLKYRDEMEDYLCHLFGTKDPDEVKRISIKDYIGKLKKGPAKRKVAVLIADGEIVRDGSGIAGERFAREVARVRADSTVKAVVFRVNSPGGEVVAADIIRREIELLGQVKPVIASYGAYAASGGYLISAGCRRIFVDNATLTGSIGVFGMVPSLGGAIRKVLKVNPVSIETDEHASMASGMEPLTPEEEEWYQEEIEDIYDDFVAIVAEGRHMTEGRVDDLAQGRVWCGVDALENGLADQRGTLMDAIQYAAREAGLGTSYRIVSVPEKPSFMKEIMGREDKKDKNPLVESRWLQEPGFHAIVRMPFLTLDPINPIAL